ncbi:hypothetical protein AK95_21185 [Paenibacillus sp. LC231]|uniref:hypothetical protein n=1 Tax=Paenibacillus sp. LC231 TaxID=1120679 RepID=UPI0008DDB542|nr:hypothetical protein [Paenibacillus sp. LC231]OIA99678.1 hypothetical protein AK95_21185 [Paenibacillus sp. LC231]
MWYKKRAVHLFIKFLLLIIILCLFRGMTDASVLKASGEFKLFNWYGPPWFFWALGLGVVLRALHVGTGLFRSNNWKLDKNRLLFLCLPMILVTVYLYIPNIKKIPLPSDFYLLAFDIHHGQLFLNLLGYFLLASFVRERNKED